MFTGDFQVAVHQSRGVQRIDKNAPIQCCKSFEPRGALSSFAQPYYESVLQLAATVFGCAPGSAVLIEFTPSVGSHHHDRPETSLSQKLCAHMIESGGIVVVSDASRDAPFLTNSLMALAPEIGFFAGVLVRTPEGRPAGALCVTDPQPRPGQITETQRTALKSLGEQVETLVKMRRSADYREEQTEAQRRLSSKLRVLTEQDALTGLHNRTLFHKQLGASVERACSSASRTAVLMLDVDHFKQVNDAFGHDAGDAVLREFGKRLKSTLRMTDTAARIGGDEFGAILHDIDADVSLAEFCRSINARLREPVAYRGRRLDCRASIGVAVYPDHARTAEQLVKCAGLALGAAKEQRGTVQLFSPEMAERFDQDVKWHEYARSVLEKKLVRPGYQPKIDLCSGGVVGFEALARLRGDNGLEQHPDVFAAAFAHPELASEIDNCMLSQVLDDMAFWQAGGTRFGRIAINCCAADFAANDFAEKLLQALAARRLSPSLVELEVTEDVFLGGGSDYVGKALRVLSGQGVRIALDDFGTGYASLTHLKEFPIDVLKIDQRFVSSVSNNADDAAIVRALAVLGETLGIETVAEGIETQEQAALVRAMGCCTAQGYLYGAALPFDEVSTAVGLRPLLKAG